MIPRKLLFIFLAALTCSAIRPHDYLTWVMEVLPAIIGAVILITTYRTFPLSNLAYLLLLLHSLILLVGGHYTYAEVPIFNWLRDEFHMQRNNFDKVGHFAQGFVPAIVAREILIRLAVVNGRKWMIGIILSTALAISAIYELIEWVAAVSLGSNAEAFLGTQGYIWDTQSDMAFALLGAISGLTLLSRVHDRQLAKLK